MKKKLLILSVFLLLFVVCFAWAQEGAPLDYGEGLVLDSDLDGLTDLGEIQKFKTNPQDPDSDGDGLLDGAEIIGGSDPLNQNDPTAVKIVKETHSLAQSEVPWSWYLTRVFGLMGFLLLYLSIIFGLAIRIPKLNTLANPIFSLDFHKWFSLHAVVFSFVHGFVLLFDKVVEFSLKDVFIPFYTDYRTIFVSLGGISFYLMIILVLTSYFRKFLKYGIWRTIHFFNIVVYLGVSVHMWFLGTDMKSFSFRAGFIVLNIILVLFIFLHLLARMRLRRKVQEQI